MMQLLFVLHKLRFLYAGILAVAASILVIWLAVTAIGPAALQSKGAESTTSIADMSMADSPNAVTNAVSIAAYNLEQTLDSAVRASGAALQSVAAATTRISKQMASAVQKSTAAVLRAVGNAFLFTARTNIRSILFVCNTVGNSTLFVLRIPGTVFGFVSDSSRLSSVIKPADHNSVPIIDSNAPAVLAAKEALPATPIDQAAAGGEAIWPMHGQVTTQFGEPGWAYRTVHAGIDISDGKPSGVTPIMAFRRGKVVTAERSGGLGNHVIVDHGSGVTSVYGHLASIAVQPGQIVDTNTTLGYEGSTGVSTGPHLHFEIRVNGQATDPRQFINGQP